MADRFTIYALRCPLTDSIHYVGLTRNPNARRAMHRSRKKRPSLAVDKWTAEWADAGQPVKWQVVAVLSGDFRCAAIAVEEAIIAKLRMSGCDLLNADLDAIRRRARPPAKLNQDVLRLMLEAPRRDGSLLTDPHPFNQSFDGG